MNGSTCAHCPTAPDGGRCPICGEVWRAGTGYPDGHDPKDTLVAEAHAIAGAIPGVAFSVQTSRNEEPTC